MDKAQQRPMVPSLPVTSTWTASVPRVAASDFDAVDLLPAAKTAVSIALFSIALVVFASNQHPLAPLSPGLATVAVRAVVPLAAALVVALFQRRPILAYASVLALTPAWNSAQVDVALGSFQIIDQTFFVAAMLVGCLVLGRRRSGVEPFDVLDDSAAWERLGRDRAGVAAQATRPRRHYRAHTFVEVGAAGFVALALLSSLASPDVATSANVLLHGIVEPLLMGAILVWLRPGRRDLFIVGAGLAFAAALGSALNVLQGLSSYGSVAAMLSRRLYFSWYTYGNVGFYGIVMAATLPIEVGLLLMGRRLRVPQRLKATLLLATGLTLVGLLFTISKSAWLSAFCATMLLAFLTMRSWWRRAALAFAAVVLSALFVPWPSVALQASPAAAEAYRTAVAQVVGTSRLNSWDISTLSGHGSVAERFYAIEGGIWMALDHPVLGIGLDQYSKYYVTGKDRPAEARDQRIDHAHSLAAEVAAELGLPAAVLLAALLVAALWAAWRAFRTARSDVSRILAASIITGLGAWAFAATIFGCVIYRAASLQASDVVTFAVLAAMAIGLGRLRQREGPNWV